MGWWKRWFGKEEEQKSIFGFDNKEPENIDEGSKEVKKREHINECCGLCQQPIGKERYKEVKGFKLHKRCWKKQAREVFNGG